jgi:hypothetical protein
MEEISSHRPILSFRPQGDAMNAKEVIRTALKGNQNMLNWYLSDLSDADLLVRPVPGANHIAWQLGHLIVSEIGLGTQYLGAKYPELPAGFKEQHDKTTASQDPPKGFGTKAEYLALFEKIRPTTLAALDKLSEADLDKPLEGSMAKFFPTVGAFTLLFGNHLLMHAGQFSVVRRKLGKPVLF